MELLDYTKKLWNNPSLKGVIIIGAQHLMESTLEMFRSLRSAGLCPSNVFLLGKCYSTSAEIYNEFRREKFNVFEKSFYFDSHQKFDDLYGQLVENFLNYVLTKIDLTISKKIIVLDDGGYLIQAINKRKEFLELSITAIEQTSSGFNSLKDISLEIPVINVARSNAKLQLETPFITDSFFKRFFKLFPQNKLNTSKILVLGKGVIGKSILNRLSNYDADSYDILDKKNISESIGNYDLIIGTSGKTSISYEWFPLLKRGVILASASSSDREFDAFYFRKQFQQSVNCLENFSNGAITLLHAGFPLNFWGSRNNIPLNDIQITLSLLMSSIFQAVCMAAKEKGILSVTSEIELKLIEKFEALQIQKNKKIPKKSFFQLTKFLNSYIKT